MSGPLANHRRLLQQQQRLLLLLLLLPTAVLGCPGACICDTSTSEELISCANTQLETVPINLITVTTARVYLHYNQITELPAAMLIDRPAALIGLTVSENAISRVDKDAFINLPNLSELFINSNVITELPAGLFDYTPKLAFLYVYSNLLQRMPILPSLPLMQQIDLSGNPMSQLNRSQLANAAPYVTALSINNLAIFAPEAVDPPFDILADFSNLRSLEMSYSNIVSLPDTFFDGVAPTLSWLSLNANQLQSLPASFFAAIASNLRTIFLQGNRLTELESRFANAYNLSKLDVSKNNIARIAPLVIHKYLMSGRRYLAFNMSRNPSVCTVSDEQVGTCICADGYGNNDGTFCDLPCHFADLPTIAFQSAWDCGMPPDALMYFGTVCTARCDIQGPNLVPESFRMRCMPSGLWGADNTEPLAKCASPIYSQDGKRQYVVVRHKASWNMAFALVETMSFRDRIGQLAIFPTAADFSTNVTIAMANETAWISGARNEANISSGLFFASAPFKNVKFYSGSRLKNGSIVEPFYVPFGAYEPNEVGGAVFVRPTRYWAMSLKLVTHNFIVMFTEGIGRNWSSFENEACGFFGACSCTGSATLCKADFISLPHFPKNSTLIVLSNRALSNIPSTFFESSMTSIHLDNNSLAAVPKGPNPLLALVDISLQDNTLTSLGDFELFSLGPNLKSVDLSENPIGPVSGNALLGLTRLTELLIFSAGFTQCLFNGTLENTAERLSCVCPSGLANDARLPSYCVNASLYRRCRSYLDNFSPKNLSANDPSVPRLVCSFPAGKPALVTCKAVCTGGFVTSGTFTCDAASLAISVATILCKVPVNKTSAEFSETGNGNSGESASMAAIAGGAGAGAFVLVLVLVFLVLRHRRLGVKKSAQDQGHQFGSFSSRGHGTIQELEDLLKLKVERLFTLAFAGRCTDAELAEAYASFATLEVARKCFKLDRVMGQGQGGEVHVARVNWPAKSARNSLPIVVAVKLLAVRRTAAAIDTAGEEALQLEARLLHQLRHPHIVQVLAVVTKSVPTWICLEFMQNGDLKSYMRACRPSLRVCKQTVTSADLVGVLRQVCSALAFLEARHVVHRDIAARNVLVGASLDECKLSDLGASRVLDESDYYRKRAQTLIPLKWMAPETLRDARYTHRSDVWAFGVLGFEVLSFGMTPYGALGGQELMAELERGYRLPQPPTCPPSLYLVLQTCWFMDPEARPSFGALTTTLAEDFCEHLGDEEQLQLEASDI